MGFNDFGKQIFDVTQCMSLLFLKPLNLPEKLCFKFD